ncbi:MAG: superfamily protein-like exporter, partial [Ilumatobacteraceae bacterium]|nr:superfamily protein-like exporter [Ilumatobacteraceae bacterium]
YQDLTQRDTAFGGDPIVVILHSTSAQGLLLDQEQLLLLIALEGRLSNLPNVAVVYGPGTVLNQTAASIQNVLATISGRRDALMNEAEEKPRSKGASKVEIARARDRSVAAFDTRYGNLLAKGMTMGLPTVRNQRFVASVMLDADGNPRPEWKFLVPDPKSATLLVRPREGLSQDGAERLTRSVRRAIETSGLAIHKPVVTGVPALSSAVADRVRTEAPLLGLAALLAVGSVFMASPWARRRRARIRPLFAALLGTASTVALFGLVGRPLSLGAVAFLPILLGIGSDFPLYLSQPTHRRRVLVTATAATVAFASLTISPLPFVREFGIALAIGLAATIAWALMLRGSFREIEPQPVDEPTTDRPDRRILRRATMAAGVLVAICGWVLLPSLHIASSPEQLAKGLPQLEQVNAAEKTLGFAGEVSLLVRGKDVLSPAVLEWQRRAEAQIVTRHGDQMRPLLTTNRLLSFLGADADASQISSGAQILPPYLLGAVATPDRTMASSTFGVEIDDVAAQGKLFDSIRDELPPPPAGYRADLVGLPVVASDGLHLMSVSRYVINLAGIAAAGLVLWIGLNRRLAVRAVLTASVASGWVLFGLRLSGSDLSPLTLAVGALITVTACEFIVMLDESRERRHRWVRRSVATAAVAGTTGYLCLALSHLEVLRDFGLVVAAGVASSYVAARLVLFAWPGDRSDDENTPSANVAVGPDLVEVGA